MKNLALWAGLAIASLSGCLGTTQADVEGGEDLSVEELSSAGRRLVGAWTGQSGPFSGLVFTETREGRGNHFFMDVDNGVRCVRAPCPSTSRVEGYFTAGAITVTLTAVPAVASPRPEYLGRFYYTLQGDTLTLSKSGRVVARLARQTSYCADADDCAEQRLVAPRCLGAWTCASSACAYRCARPTCANVRCAAGTFCQETDEGPRCITNCATVRCASGTTCVADAQGAHCEPNGTPCGTATCAEGLVCCNPLRGLCVRPGMFCIQ